MAALASMLWSRLAVWPRLLAVAALLALTFAGGHESPRSTAADGAQIRVAAQAPKRLVLEPPPQPLGRVLDPGAFADAREWPRGMVIRPPETGDHMPTARVPAPLVASSGVPAPLPPGPVGALLSGLFELLGSRGA